MLDNFLLLLIIHLEHLWILDQNTGQELEFIEKITANEPIFPAIETPIFERTSL